MILAGKIAVLGAVAALALVFGGKRKGGAVANKFFRKVGTRIEFTDAGRTAALNAMRNFKVTAGPTPDGPQKMEPIIDVPSAYALTQTMHAGGFDTWVTIDNYDQIWWRITGVPSIQGPPLPEGARFALLVSASKPWRD